MCVCGRDISMISGVWSKNKKDRVRVCLSQLSNYHIPSYSNHIPILRA